MSIYYLSNVAFFGFAIYSLFYIVFKHFTFFKSNTVFEKIDQATRIVVGLAGVLFAQIWMLEIISILCGDDLSNRDFLMKRMLGKYAFGFWLQPLCTIIFSQLVWFKKLAKHSLFRFVIALFLFIDFEKLVIIITSLHRDYLPSSWTMYEDFSFLGWMISSWIIKLFFFASMVVVVYYIKNRKTT